MLSVDELTNMVKNKVNSIQNVNVRGEIGKISKPNSGHIYFDLMSQQSKINCVVWKNSNLIPESGEAEVLIRHIDFYPPFGKCQAIISNIVNIDIEAQISAQRQALIAKLETEGILKRHRLKIPEIVQHICIITSDGSAACHDMMEGIQARWPGLKTTLIHTMVQGNQAIEYIERAFEKLHTLSQVDVVVCGRGGGSDTDLAIFDHERVVRRFINFNIPVISAIGHESDISICDMVADVRAKTPTAAIEIAIPLKKEDAQTQLTKLTQQLTHSTQSTLTEIRKLLQNLKVTTVYNMNSALAHFQTKFKHNSYMLKCISANKLDSNIISCKRGTLHSTTLHRVQQLTKKNAYQTDLLTNHINRLFTQYHLHIQYLKTKLDAFSHQNTIKRGFCIIRDGARIVKSISYVKQDSDLCVVMQDGFLDVVVKRCRLK